MKHNCACSAKRCPHPLHLPWEHKIRFTKYLVVHHPRHNLWAFADSAICSRIGSNESSVPEISIPTRSVAFSSARRANPCSWHKLFVFLGLPFSDKSHPTQDTPPHLHQIWIHHRHGTLFPILDAVFTQQHEIWAAELRISDRFVSWTQQIDINVTMETWPSDEKRRAFLEWRWRVRANSPQPGNSDANVTFDCHSIPKVTFAMCLRFQGCWLFAQSPCFDWHVARE